MERGISFSRFGAAKRTGGGEGGVAAALDPRKDPATGRANGRTTLSPFFGRREKGREGR